MIGQRMGRKAPLGIRSGSSVSAGVLAPWIRAQAKPPFQPTHD